MHKIGKLFRILQALLQRPSLIMRVLDENEPWKRRIRRSYGYTELPSLEITALFPSLSGEGVQLHPYLFLEGGSMPTDLAALRLFARHIPECRYFEIGTWRGESVMNVAAEGAVCHTLNMDDNGMLKAGYSREECAQVGMLIEGHPKVILHRADSADFDFSAPRMRFDLVFIDGDHHYDQVRRIR